MPKTMCKDKNYLILWTTIYQQSRQLRKKIEKILEIYNLPKLNQEKIGNLSRPIANKEIESLIKTVPRKKRPAPDGFPGKF